MSERNRLNPWYVTGFCDGEAAFTYSRAGGSFNVYFSLTQREDNRQIIDDIQAFFDYAGKIYHKKGAQPAKNSGHTKPSWYYRVATVDEIPIIIDHFDKYPMQSKKKWEAYRIWREMVMHKIENFREPNYDKLRELAARLSSLNSKSMAFKIHSR
jgi:hypothetical protein